MNSLPAVTALVFALIAAALLFVCLRLRSALRAAEAAAPIEVLQPADLLPAMPAALPVSPEPAPAPAPAMASTPDLFQQVGDRMHEIVVVQGQTILYANPQFAALAGTEREALIGTRLHEMVEGEQQQSVAENLRQRLLGAEVPERYEIDLIGRQGQMTRLEIATTAVQFAGQQALLITGVEVIPTQSVRTLSGGMPESLRSRARNTLDCLGEALLTTDTAGRIDYANPAACQLLGADMRELRGATVGAVISLVDDTDRKLLADPVDLALHSGSGTKLVRRAVLLAHASGSERSIELSVSPIRGRDNASEEVTGVVLLMHDVTEVRGLARQMSYQATHDGLTGLVNRAEFEQRLNLTLQSAHRGEVAHVLCYIDLDHFKAVNDNGGHLAGDSMLREVSKLMRQTVRDSDTVARLGGDEFALLLVGCPLEKGRQIADDLVRTIADFRFVWKDRIFTIGASVGLVELARDSGTLEEALAAADSACYVAKKQGSGHVAVYSARDEVVARQSGEIQWLQTLQTAIRDNLFRLFCQPIVADYGHDEGGPAMEVLVRLADIDGREVPPLDFLRAAERYRLMSLIDRWVVQNTLTALGRGLIELPPTRSLAINISAQTLIDAQFLEFVVDCFDRTGVNPAQVCFELPEAAVVANIDHARRFVGVLHGLGSQFALDDFGSNLGSFSNLKNLPIDYLKIDGSFMRNLARDSVNQAMVTAMVKLARTLNFKVIAEQVEDAAILEMARSMGIDFMQGYAVGRPRPLSLAA